MSYFVDQPPTWGPDEQKARQRAGLDALARAGQDPATTAGGEASLPQVAASPDLVSNPAAEAARAASDVESIHNEIAGFADAIQMILEAEAGRSSIDS